MQPKVDPKYFMKVGETPEAYNARVGYVPGQPASDATPGYAIKMPSEKLKDIPTTFYSGNIQDKVIPDLNAKYNKLTNSGQFMDANGNKYNADGTPVSQETDTTQTDVETPINPHDSEIKNVQSQLNAWKTTSDQISTEQISNIQQQYENLRNETEKAYRTTSEGMNQALLLGGSSRYAPLSSGGIITTLADAHATEMGKIINAENSAIMAVKQAKSDNDYKLLNAEMNRLETLRKEKQAVLTKQAEEVAKKTEEVRQENLAYQKEGALVDAYSKGITDPVELFKDLKSKGIKTTFKEVSDFLTPAKADTIAVRQILQKVAEYPGVPQDILQKISMTKNPNEAIMLASRYLQDPKLSLELEGIRLDNVKKAQALKSDKEVKAEMTDPSRADFLVQQKLNTIKELENHAGLDSRVGPNKMARGMFALSDSFGAGQEFAGTVHNLIQGMTLQNLIDAKKNGATFGALSIPELNMLAQSATKINDWEVSEVIDGQKIGKGEWNIDEASFKKELENIKTLLLKNAQFSGGMKSTYLAPEEVQSLNNIYGESSQNINPANYF